MRMETIAVLEVLEDARVPLDETEIARRTFADIGPTARARIRSAVMLLHDRGDVLLVDATDDGDLVWKAAE